MLAVPHKSGANFSYIFQTVPNLNRVSNFGFDYLMTMSWDFYAIALLISSQIVSLWIEFERFKNNRGAE